LASGALAHVPSRAVLPDGDRRPPTIGREPLTHPPRILEFIGHLTSMDAPMIDFDSLAARLEKSYDLYLASRIDERAGALFERDWPALSRTTAAILRRIGSPVWFLGRNAYRPQDDTPYVVVGLDGGAGLVSFRPATIGDLDGCRFAALYDELGRSILDRAEAPGRPHGPEGQRSPRRSA
jgi:hypothetical protein